MNTPKNPRPTPDDHDRNGNESGVNQVNPNDTPATRGTDAPSHQGGDPSEVKAQPRQPNRDSQPDGKRDAGQLPGTPDRDRQRSDKRGK